MSKSQVQAVVFVDSQNKQWSLPEMKAVLKANGWAPIKPMHRVGRLHRWRLHSPSKYRRFTTTVFESKSTLGKVNLVIGWY